MLFFGGTIKHMQDGQQGENQNNEPGWVFKPGDQSSSSTDNAQPAPYSDQSQIIEQSSPAASDEPPTPSQEGFENHGEPLVSWTASEYQANPKSAGWFGSLAIASILLAVIIYLLTRDLVSTVVIALVGVIVGIFGARQPRVLQYHLDEHGIYIETKFYPYNSFKSFSIGQDQAIHYIYLLSLKRFMPPLTVHFDPADENAVANTLANYLPYEEHKPDIVDSLSRRIRL